MKICTKNSTGRLYDENDEWVVNYDFKNGYFWYHYQRFYLIFKENFELDINDFSDLCKYILEKHLNYKELSPRFWFD